MKNVEIEFKYKASIALTEFNDFCESRKPDKFVIISGFDHFYSSKSDKDSFYRHRVNTNENQLTFKKKLTVDNNFIRKEHNIDLPMSVSEDKIGSLCEINGYEYDISIFKNCFIYNYDYYTLVYYICYDKNLTELGRFIEIEMKEDYDWRNEEEAYGELVSLERLCKSIGASPDNRLNLSLFEMFRRRNDE
jgi:adenylate cyclase class IV